MSLYFSVSRDGFYNSEAGVPIPDDVIEITEDQYNHFLFTMNQEMFEIIGLSEFFTPEYN